MAEVMAVEPGFLIPRMVIHICSASKTTMTPLGRSVLKIVSAIFEVKRSCNCGLLAKRFNDSSQFTKTYNPPFVRNITKMRFTKKRNKMVFTKRVKRKIP